MPDTALLERVREGDAGAYGDLFARHHDAATRYACSLCDPARADDLVAEAFTRVYANLTQRRLGPIGNLRSYLFSTIRNLFLNQLRDHGRVTLVGEQEQLETLRRATTSAADAEVADGIDGEAIARAFQSLPARWRMVLWETVVDPRPREEITARLGLSSNALAALCFRAREGLRLAYLRELSTPAQSRLAPDSQPGSQRGSQQTCSAARLLLPALTRQQVGVRDRSALQAHLATCPDCARAFRRLQRAGTTEKSYV